MSEQHVHEWDNEYKENPNCLICKVCKMCYCQAHEIELEQQLAAANPQAIIELLDRLALAEKVAEAASEFCQTAVYVQSEYIDRSHACLTSTDAVAKMRHFVKEWQNVKEVT